MKLVTFSLLLMLTPAFAAAQDMAAKEAAAPKPSAGRFEHAAVELNALYGSKFGAGPDLYSEIKQTGRFEPGVIGAWNERVFKAFSQYAGPRRQDPADDSRLLSKDELDARAGENRTVSRVVLKETLKFTQERMPEVDRLVKALRFEVSNGTSGESQAEAVLKENGNAAVAKDAQTQDKVFVKTGLRLRVESASFGLVSETEAKYSNVSYFYRVNLDNQNDNSVGLTYAVSRNVSIQVERNFTGTMDPATREKPTRNLVQVVRTF